MTPDEYYRLSPHNVAEALKTDIYSGLDEKSGDKIFSDAQLVQSFNFQVEEAALT